MNKILRKSELRDQNSGDQRIQLIRYRESDVEELDIVELSQIPPQEGHIHWLNVIAPVKDLLIELTSHFELHPLTRDYHDVAGQRPALYEFDNHLLITARILSLENQTIRSELIGLVMGSGFVITLQEYQEDDFEQVRNRIREKIGWIRMRGSDHLYYQLLDAITEEYFLVAEHLEDQAESLMNALEAGDSEDIPARIRVLRQSGVEFRRAVSPLRDVLASLIKSETKQISKPVLVFLRDVHQQSIQLVDVGQTLMDQIKEIQDRHHLLVSERMNDTVKVLTVVTSFFIPLSFLAGIYGMNFKNMPELDWPFGYYGFWILTIVITVVMFIAFRRRKWF